MSEPSTRRVDVKFFAILREQAGVSNLAHTTQARDPAGLYQELQSSLGLKFPVHLLRVAVNDRYTTMDTALSDGDRVVFIPPVAGG